MPVCSYIVYPAAGQLQNLTQKLTALEGCQVLPAENRELLILLTDTNSGFEEVKLRERLEGIREIQSMALTFGDIDGDRSD